MDTATRRALDEGARALGAPLDGRALDAFARYLALLEKWNARINLTRIVDEAEVLAKHFLDSLAVARHLGSATSLVDVGAGAGFPGVPLAIARPGLAVTLVESIAKKTAFLEAVKRELGLPLTVETTRLERFVASGLRFDVAVSRATLAPQQWLVAGAPLVAPGGLLVAMLGRERPPLEPPANFGAVELYEYSLPTEGARALALLRHTA